MFAARRRERPAGRRHSGSRRRPRAAPRGAGRPGEQPAERRGVRLRSSPAARAPPGPRGRSRAARPATGSSPPASASVVDGEQQPGLRPTLGRRCRPRPGRGGRRRATGVAAYPPAEQVARGRGPAAGALAPPGAAAAWRRSSGLDRLGHGSYLSIIHPKSVRTKIWEDRHGHRRDTAAWSMREPGTGRGTWAMGSLFEHLLEADQARGAARRGAGDAAAWDRDPAAPAHPRGGGVLPPRGPDDLPRRRRATSSSTTAASSTCPQGVPHAFRIRGDAPARFLALTAPGRPAAPVRRGRASRPPRCGCPGDDGLTPEVEIPKWAEVGPRYGLEVVGPPIPE